MEMKSKLEQSIILTCGGEEMRCNKPLEDYLYILYELKKDMILDNESQAEIDQTDAAIKLIESKLYGRD